MKHEIYNTDCGVRGSIKTFSAKSSFAFDAMITVNASTRSGTYRGNAECI